jgi:hypothetical protein
VYGLPVLSFNLPAVALQLTTLFLFEFSIAMITAKAIVTSRLVTRLPEIADD